MFLDSDIILGYCFLVKKVMVIADLKCNATNKSLNFILSQSLAGCSCFLKNSWWPLLHLLRGRRKRRMNQETGPPAAGPWPSGSGTALAMGTAAAASWSPGRAPVPARRPPAPPPPRLQSFPPPPPPPLQQLEAARRRWTPPWGPLLPSSRCSATLRGDWGVCFGRHLEREERRWGEFWVCVQGSIGSFRLLRYWLVGL